MAEPATETMTRTRLVETMRAKRAELEGLLAAAGAGRMLEPVAGGQWSLKDILAHITVYERYTLRRLQAGLRGETYVRSAADEIADIDARNAAYQAADQARSAADVQTEAQQVFRDLLALVESLPEGDLASPARFGFKETRPWELIAGNGYEHYDDHIPQIRAWLAGA